MKQPEPKAFVLCSGGIDSTTCLYMAVREFPVVEVIGIKYGQRHSKELEYASMSCIELGVPATVLDLSSVMPRTMLTDRRAEVPDISYDQIVGVSPTYAPFRNGLMLSAVASYAHGQHVELLRNDPELIGGEWAIYFGAHAEDARNWAYPDCTPEFIGAMANAIRVGTYNAVRLRTPLEWMTKPEIIVTGEVLGVDWRSTWSCYKGGEVHCGTCPTCRARKNGFVAAGVSDPTVYAA